jgi:hypothetical protein
MKKTTKELKRYIETLKQRQTAYTKQIEVMRMLSQNYNESIHEAEGEIRRNLKDEIVSNAKYKKGEIFEANDNSSIQFIKIESTSVWLGMLYGDENPSEYDISYHCYIKRRGEKSRWSRVQLEFKQSQIDKMRQINKL